MLLDSCGLETELGGDGCDGASVVGLDSTDGDEGVGTFGLGLGSEVSEFQS